jgi:hypothetical protein
MDLEAFQKYPTILKKQLMKEEKMVKRIKRDFPKITQALERDCLKWKADPVEEFLYHSEIYLDRRGSLDGPQTWRSS